MIVPLWPETILDIKDRIRQELPEWVGVDVNAAGRYLGFVARPGKGSSSRTKANLRYEERVCLGGSQAPDLQYSAITYIKKKQIVYSTPWYQPPI